MSMKQTCRMKVVKVIWDQGQVKFNLLPKVLKFSEDIKVVTTKTGDTQGSRRQELPCFYKNSLYLNWKNVCSQEKG